MGADAVDRLEQQRRELEELRRSFKEQGTPPGALFEPAPPDKPKEAEKARPKKPAGRPPAADSYISVWALPVVVSLLLLVAGTGLGYLLHRPDAVSGQPTASTVVADAAPETKLVPPPPAWRPPAVVTRP